MADSITLDELSRAASANKSVELIPFKSIYSEASSIAREVEDRKAAAVRWDYDTFEKQRNNLLKDKAAKQSEIDDIQKFVDDFKSRHKECDVSSFENDKNKRRDDIKEFDAKIEKMNGELEKAAEDWKRFWNARGGLREKFDDALDEAKKGESNSGDYIGSSASDDDKQKAKGYFSTIISKIESEEKEHLTQEEGAKATEARFRELIKKTTL